MANRPAPWNYAGEFSQVYSTFATSGTPQRIVRNDARRVCLIFSALGGVTTAFVRPESQQAASFGLLLPSNGDWQMLHFAEIGTIVSSEWYCFTSGAPGNVAVLEVFYAPIQSNSEGG